MPPNSIRAFDAGEAHSFMLTFPANGRELPNYNHLTDVKYVKSAKPSQTIKYQFFLSIKYREKVTC